MHKSLLVISALLIGVTTAAAQDPTVVDSDHYAVVFENDHVRVLRITYGPGEESVMHEHPGHVAVALTPGTWSMTFPNGESMEISQEAGEVIWAPAGPHLPKNTLDKAAEVIVVEVKGHMEMEAIEAEED